MRYSALRWLLALAVGIVAPALIVPLARAQSQPAVRAPLPTTGIDDAGIDAFYRIADLLVNDQEPTELQWEELLGTPGYRLLEIAKFGSRRRIRLALKPSLAASRDSLTGRSSGQAEVVRHIREAVAERSVVLRTRDALRLSLRDSIAVALPRTARYLPAGTIAHFGVPFVGLAIFANDGFATDSGVVLDPLTISRNGVVDLIAHEFHHSYGAWLTRTYSAAEALSMQPPRPDIPVYATIVHLRNEGMADQIDKPFPLTGQDTAYVRQYSALYARTPSILRSFDSLLVALPHEPQLAGRAQTLFWANGHPNGAYMARTIVQTFGVDSLVPAIYDPFTLIYTYAAAEAVQHAPPSFSPQALATLRAMETRYLRPGPAHGLPGPRDRH